MALIMYNGASRSGSAFTKHLRVTTDFENSNLVTETILFKMHLFMPSSETRLELQVFAFAARPTNQSTLSNRHADKPKF